MRRHAHGCRGLIAVQLRFAIFKRPRNNPAPPRVDSFTCFNVRNTNSGWLVATGSTGRKSQVIFGRPGPATWPGIILCVPDGNPQIGFLIAANGETIATHDDMAAARAIAVVVERGPPDTPIKFLHPINPGWQLGLSEAEGRADGAIVFEYRSPHRDFEFILEKIEEEALPHPARRVAREIAAHISVPARHEPLLSAIGHGVLRPDLAGPVLSSLPIDELETVAVKLMQDEPLRSRLRACLQEDRWISDRLGLLVAWRTNRDKNSFASRSITFAEADDIPGSKKSISYRPTLGLALNALARRNTQPRRMACVVASARNEGPYLLDWIAHHLAVGFNHLFIYTNDNTDGSDALLEILARAGVITWLDNKIGPQSRPQFRAYAHALSILPQTLDYRWTLVADLDEYFAYDAERFRSVSDYLAWQEVRRAEAIALPWLIYVAGRGDIWRDAPCTERFINRDPQVNNHVKSMFRSNLHWSSTCHNPIPMLDLPINYRAQNRAPHIAKQPENNKALAQNPQATHAWIAHYIFKSAPEALMKLHRGRGDAARAGKPADMAGVMKPFVSLSNKPNVIADVRTLKSAQGMAEELSRLRQIPGVWECEKHIKEQYSSQMSAACARFVREGPIAGEARECAEFRSMLLGHNRNALFSVAAV